MIVTCEECKTSFQLDEARIPATGAQVRCSRCKHAFFLPNPTASQTDAINAAASEALEGRAGVPHATEDLGAGASGRASSTPAAPSAEPDLDEEDWQFSEEIRVEGDDQEDVLSGEFSGDLSEDLDDESDFGENPDFSQGIDQSQLAVDVSTNLAEGNQEDGLQVVSEAMADSGEGSGLELDSGPEPEPTGRDESSFGSIDDFSELMEDDDSGATLDPGPESAASADVESIPETPIGTYSEKGTSDDLGDPESWDLVGSDDFAAGHSAVHAKRSVAAGPLGQAISAEDFFFEGSVDEGAYPDESFRSAFLTGPVAKLGRLVGWVAATLFVGMVSAVALQSGWAHFRESPQRVSVGPLHAETTASGWVETSRAGPVLRFVGELRNASNQSVWPGIVQIALLDAEGTRLAVPAITAGTPLAEEVLRESTTEGLLASSASATRRLGERPLAPGEVRRFEAIVIQEQLPLEARRVLLEVGEPVPRPVRLATPPQSAVSAAGEAAVSAEGESAASADGESAQQGGSSARS